MSAIEKSGPATYSIPTPGGHEVRTRIHESYQRGPMLVVELLDGLRKAPTAASPRAGMLTSLDREGVKALLQACVDFLVAS